MKLPAGASVLEAVKVEVDNIILPQTLAQVFEFDHLKLAIASMRLTNVDLSWDGKTPYVRIAYLDADLPQWFWGRYLAANVELVKGGGWRAWLSHINPDRCELLLEPKGRDQYHLACAAHAASDNPRVRTLKLGTMQPSARKFILPDDLVTP